MDALHSAAIAIASFMPSQIEERSASRGAETLLEAKSATLRRELGVGDLVLTQILFVVGLPWVGVAAKQGSSHVVFWLLAMVFFYLPSAAVVIHLNRAMPF